MATDVDTLQLTGWEPIELAGFSASVGPLSMRGTGAEREVGFIAESRHANTNIGTVHGGVLMTFADIALGLGVVDVIGGRNCVTAQLQLHFVSTAKIGTLVSCRAEIIRHSRHLVFMRGLITSDGATVASADGIWKVLEARTGADQPKA